VDVRGLEKAYPRPLRFRDLPGRLRRRQQTPALRGLDLQVAPGRVYGLLGPNGAGKTTLMKVLCGMLLPDAGTARVEGLDVLGEPQRVKARVGYVPSDERSFYWRLTGRQNLLFFGRLQGLRGAELSRRIEEVLEKVDLAGRGDERFDGYSTGLKQRLALARGLLHDPSVLLLDEPTRSLDPSAAHRLRRLLREQVVQEMGKTVLLATHDLHEALDLCHRVALIQEGRVLREGPPAEVLERRATGGWRLEVSGVGREILEEGEGRASEGEGGVLGVDLGPEADLGTVLQRVLDRGGRVLSVEPARPALEEVFSALVEAEGGDRG